MDINNIAINTFKLEAQSILDLEFQLTDDFSNAVHAVINSTGRLIITGVGKSGLIGSKIAATLASTGTPSFFINPVDAFHGDLGMITPLDIVMAISNSGQTDELLRIVPYLKKRNIPIIGLTGNPNSLLAANSTYHFNIAVKNEACPLNLAPTSSTTATLAMGDAFAVCLMNVRNFKAEDFAQFHPGGNLGYRLLTQVKDVMQITNLPIINKKLSIADAIIEISKAKLGLAIVVENDEILGIITDGDIRRTMQKHQAESFNMSVKEIMTTNPICINQEDKLMDAEQMFKKKSIHTLVVCDQNNKLAGILDSVKCVF